MKASELIIRHAVAKDQAYIFELFKAVSKNIGGIARQEDEITMDYVTRNLTQSMQNGVCLVIEHPQKEKGFLAQIHCYKLEPRVFSHVLSELTIVVHPDYHSKGLGKKLFMAMIEYVEKNRKDIMRIELIARESNQKAIKLYQSIGFCVEGKMEKRICTSPGVLEADIPMAWFNKNFQPNK